MTKSWIRGFEVAKAASLHSNAPRTSRKVGAAIFSGNKLLAIGFNVWSQTHTKAGNGIDFNRNIHAEHKAVLKRQHYDFPGDIIYIYRQTHNGNLACSKPCLNCQIILKEAGIKRIRFFDINGIMKEEVI